MAPYDSSSRGRNCRGHHCALGWSVIFIGAICESWVILHSSRMTIRLPLLLTGCASAGFWRRPTEDNLTWPWKVGSLSCSGTLLRRAGTETPNDWIKFSRAASQSFSKLENYLCRLFLIGCIIGSRKLRFLKSSPILLAYIALLGLILTATMSHSSSTARL